MQSLDLLGLQRHRRIAPTEADIRMMAFGFRELANLVNKGQRLPEIAKPEAPLDAVSFFHQLPVRRLRLKELGLFASEWRDSPATGSAGFACKSFGHCACSLCLPSPAKAKPIERKSITAETSAAAEHTLDSLPTRNVTPPALGRGVRRERSRAVRQAG